MKHGVGRELNIILSLTIKEVVRFQCSINFVSYHAFSLLFIFCKCIIYGKSQAC